MEQLLIRFLIRRDFRSLCDREITCAPVNAPVINATGVVLSSDLAYSEDIIYIRVPGTRLMTCNRVSWRTRPILLISSSL